MTKHDVTTAVSGIKQLLGEDDGFLREGLRGYLQEVLESEMTALLGASKGERVGRPGWAIDRATTSVPW